MNTEQERAEFEAWCHTRSLDIGRDDKGDYISLETYLSWEGYQAGRAALQSQDREDDPDTIRALLAERDALREALEAMVEMVEMNGFGRAYAMDVARAAPAQGGGMSTPIKKDWTTESGLRAVIVMNSLGFHCGYVGVPQGHPLYGVGYSQSTPVLGDSPESIFDVHGGITYAGDGKGEYPVKSDSWWFGYDCGHLWDAPCQEHIEKMKRDYPDEPVMWERSQGVFRDVDYCVDECEKLARQIQESVKS